MGEVIHLPTPPVKAYAQVAEAIADIRAIVARTNKTIGSYDGARRINAHLTTISQDVEALRPCDCEPAA